MQCAAAAGAAVLDEKAAGVADSQAVMLTKLDAAQTMMAARLAEQEALMQKLLALVDSQKDLCKAYHGKVMAQYALTNSAGVITRYVLHEDGRVFTNAAKVVAAPDPEAKRKAALEAERRQVTYEATVLPAEIAELRARQRAAKKGLVYNEKTRQVE